MAQLERLYLECTTAADGASFLLDSEQCPRVGRGLLWKLFLIGPVHANVTNIWEQLSCKLTSKRSQYYRWARYFRVDDLMPAPTEEWSQDVVARTLSMWNEDQDTPIVVTGTLNDFTCSSLATKQQNHSDTEDSNTTDENSSPTQSPSIQHDHELLRTIRLDVKRLTLAVGHVQAAENALKRILERVLYIWCRQRPCMGYRQGMHEICNVLAHVVLRDALTLQMLCPSVHTTCLNELCGISYAEADCYVLFEAVMNDIGPLYASGDEDVQSSLVKLSSPRRVACSSPEAQSQTSAEADLAYCTDDDHSASGCDTKCDLSKCGSMRSLQEASARIQHLHLFSYDPALHTHLAEIGIEPHLYALRWLRLLFLREFQPDVVIRLWDAMFAASVGFYPMEVIKWCSALTGFQSRDASRLLDISQCAVAGKEILAMKPRTIIDSCEWLSFMMIIRLRGLLLQLDQLDTLLALTRHMRWGALNALDIFCAAQSLSHITDKLHSTEVDIVRKKTISIGMLNEVLRRNNYRNLAMADEYIKDAANHFSEMLRQALLNFATTPFGTAVNKPNNDVGTGKNADKKRRKSFFRKRQSSERNVNAEGGSRETKSFRRSKSEKLPLKVERMISPLGQIAPATKDVSSILAELELDDSANGSSSVHRCAVNAIPSPPTARFRFTKPPMERNNENRFERSRAASAVSVASDPERQESCDSDMRTRANGKVQRFDASKLTIEEVGFTLQNIGDKLKELGISMTENANAEGQPRSANDNWQSTSERMMSCIEQLGQIQRSHNIHESR